MCGQLSTRWFLILCCFGCVLADKLGPKKIALVKESVPSPPLEYHGIPAEWTEMCEFLEREWRGEEGAIDDERFRLRGVAIAFRHGERSPIHADASVAGCVASREEDRRDFEAYRKLVESDDFAYFLRTDAKFAKFSKIPSSSVCAVGQMTAEGALQHVKLGKYMREKYAGSNIFSPDSRLDLSVTASQYNRTFQSAIAFTSSFLFPSKTFVPQILIQASNFTYLCMNRNCQCEKSPKWRSQYENELLSYFTERSPEEFRRTAELLRTHSAFSRAHDPFQIIDVALGRYVCRRKPLPCFGKAGCLSYEFLSQLVNETTIRGKVMFDEGERYIAQKLQLVEGHGVLYHLAETVAKLRKFPHTNSIQIFSGHDVTIAPLLRTLNVPLVDPPHYLSHLVVEVGAFFQFYEQVDSASAKDSILLRFIYNGVDVTRYVSFCEDSPNNGGLCAGDRLESFVRHEIFQALEAKSLSEVCN
ncbi:unnamed protein product [Heligmosomoides polygyrus]|uniref:2,3-bisphosphoglycerate 3-phosphatase n=1 Tax=Heligmosomoides polygyrus TaxID=6339 RepID=A0A3P7Y5C4_HELPZ|nr:unnamed protein product [Heligmosomoides polygyrus]